MGESSARQVKQTHETYIAGNSGHSSHLVENINIKDKYIISYDSLNYDISKHNVKYYKEFVF